MDAISRQKSPSGHHRTTLSRYIFAAKAHIDSRKKNLLSSDISSTRSHNMVNFGPLVAEIDAVGSLGHPCKFQRVSRLGSATVRHSSIVHQPNFATLNRRRHLYLAGRPLRLAFSSPNLSGRRLDVYHTSTHDVALVRI